MILLPLYLKVAVRNLRRYPVQTLISIVGLAAGFVCLTLSNIWIHYKDTFNADIPHVDRIYKVAACNDKDEDCYVINDEFYQQLKDIPEVEAYTSMSLMGIDKESRRESGYANRPGTYDCYVIDSTFTNLFPLDVLSGSIDFIKQQDTERYIITQSLAREAFGEDSPIDQTFNDIKVGAVVKDFDPHSSLCASLLMYQPQRFHSWVFVKLREGADAEVVTKKLNALSGGMENVHHYSLLPMRGGYDLIHEFSHEANLSYDHVKAFRWASVCLVLCAFAGYLVLYLNRTHSRRREMALHSVHGASPRQNVLLFASESLLVFCGAIVLGLLSILVLAEPFAAYADVVLTDGLLLGQSLLCMAVCMAMCMVLCLLSTAIVCRRPLQQSLQTSSLTGRLFQCLSIGIQLVLSIALAFCVTVMLLQFRYQRTTDWGHNAYGTMYFSNPYAPGFDSNYWQSRLASLPMVEDVSIERHGGLTRGGWYVSLSNDPACDTIYFRAQTPTDPSNPHWQLKVLEGRLPSADEWQPDEIAITESVAKALGLQSPVVGQTLYHGNAEPVKVVAVVRDIVTFDGNVPSIVEPDRILLPDDQNVKGKLAVFFPPTQRKELSEAIRALAKQEEELQGKEVNYLMHFVSDDYEDALRKDRNMAWLLGIVTGVDLFVALFGIYSIVTLTCRQRRKEIAIRKVHGAKRRDIVKLFVREYGIILIFSTAIAFLAGTLLIRRWLENYVMQVPLTVWLYVALFLATALLIALCVGSRLLRTARENPVEVVKSE